MDSTTLVEASVEAGAKLVKALDAGTPLGAALWFYYSDTDSWRLLLASPEFDALGKKDPTLAYKRVAEAMGQLGDPTNLRISDIKIVDTTEPVFQALRMLVQTGPTDLGRLWVESIYMNGVLIERALIYRLT